MKTELMPDWTKEQKAEGERTRQVWEKFFSTARTEKETSGLSLLNRAEEIRIAEIRARHEAELLRYPNVVGVGEGIRIKGGKPTGEPCLVVSVKTKLPPNKLKTDEILPDKIEGIPVDVVEVGKVELL